MAAGTMDDTMDIKDITVEETIKEGKSIYRKGQ